MPGEPAVGVAARRRQRQKAFEVRQDQIEDLLVSTSSMRFWKK